MTDKIHPYRGYGEYKVPAYKPWPVWVTNFRQSGFFDRAVKIEKMRQSGMTLKSIGVEFDICQERVRQILWRNKRNA